MMRRMLGLAPVVVTLLVGALVQAGCATTTTYTPQLVARGEITLAYDGGFKMSAGGQPLSAGYGWRGLAHYVRCVPEAKRHAEQASSNGIGSIILSALGGTFGVAGGVGGLTGAFMDQNNFWAWLGSGIGVAVVGTVFAGVGRMLKNSANGHAVDAMNHYNDAVGSLGATCDDLTYPPPVDLPPPPTAAPINVPDLPVPPDPPSAP